MPELLIPSAPPRTPSAARLTAAPGSRSRTAAVAGGVLAAVFLFHLSFLRYAVLTDYDAASFLAYLRLRDSPFDLPSLYTLHSVLTWAVNAAARAFGAADHYLAAWRVVVALAVTASAGLVFSLTRTLTRSLPLAALAAALLAVNPAVGSLALIGEDNLVSSLFNLSYLAAYLALLSELRHPVARRRRLALSAAACGVAFVLAILAHRQHAVLIPTLAALPLLAGAVRCGRALRVTAGLALACGALLAVSFAALAWAWSGRLGWDNFAYYVKDWFVPGQTYHDFYFFRCAYWSPTPAGIWAHVQRIFAGVGQLLACRPAHALGLFIILLPCLGWLLRVGARAGVHRDPRFWTLAMFAAVHVPHSLVYESWNVERWDAIVPVLIVLACALAGGVGERRARRWMLALGVGLALTQLAFCLQARRPFDQLLARDDVAAFTRKMRLAARPPALGPGRRLMVVLSPEEARNLYPIAATYYNFRDSIMLADPERGLMRSRKEYLEPDSLSATELAARAAAGELVVGREAEPLLDTAVPGWRAQWRALRVE